MASALGRWLTNETLMFAQDIGAGGACLTAESGLTDKGYPFSGQISTPANHVATIASQQRIRAGPLLDVDGKSGARGDMVIRLSKEDKDHDSLFLIKYRHSRFSHLAQYAFIVFLQIGRAHV